jgi:solute carrier family 35 protein F5
MSQDGLDPPLEMDTLPIHPSSTGKSPAPNKLAQRDYAVGICLLLSVVFLWTASNFVTQVQSFEPSLLRTVTTRVLEIRTCSLGDMRNLSCLYRLFFDVRNTLLMRRSITYLTTSSFSLYLLPFLIRGSVRRCRGGSDQQDGIR